MKRPQIVKRIREILKTTILYGSEARGDVHWESDIDLLILVDKPKVPVAEMIESLVAYRLERAYNVLLEAMRSMKSIIWQNEIYLLILIKKTYDTRRKIHY